jgi:hypothetical protein
MPRNLFRLAILLLTIAAFATSPASASSGIILDKSAADDVVRDAIALYRSAVPHAAGEAWAFPEAGTCSVTPIACNTNAAGNLGFGDCTLDSDGTYVDIWTFSGTAGQKVTITMRSSAFDSYLALGDPSGNIVAEDDNSAGGSDARVTHTLTSSGTWGIIANQWTPASGSYTISLQCESGTTDCTPQVRTTSCGLTVSGTIDTNDCEIEGLRFEFWTLTASAGQTFTASATRTSGTGNIGLVVFHDDGTDLGDDMPDSGSSTVTGVLPKGGTWVVAVLATSSAGYSLTTSCQTQSSGCTPTADNLCLANNRFRVIVSAKDPRTGKTGTGRAVPYNNANGFFSLPALTGDTANFEIFVKILDGRPVNGRWWVFYGGLTDFEYTITVTDAVSGQNRKYTKPGFQYVGGADTNAFQ